MTQFSSKKNVTLDLSQLGLRDVRTVLSHAASHPVVLKNHVHGKNLDHPKCPLTSSSLTTHRNNPCTAKCVFTPIISFLSNTAPKNKRWNLNMNPVRGAHHFQVPRENFPSCSHFASAKHSSRCPFGIACSVDAWAVSVGQHLQMECDYGLEMVFWYLWYLCSPHQKKLLIDQEDQIIN